MRPAWSSGCRQAGRVLEFADERLEQKNHQEMSQHIRLCGPFIDAGRSFKPSFLLVEMYIIDPAQIFSAAGSITGYNGSLRPCERRSQQLQRLLLDGCWAGCHRQHVIGIGCSGYLVEA